MGKVFREGPPQGPQGPLPSALWSEIAIPSQVACVPLAFCLHSELGSFLENLRLPPVTRYGAQSCRSELQLTSARRGATEEKLTSDLLRLRYACVMLALCSVLLASDSPKHFKLPCSTVAYRRGLFYTVIYMCILLAEARFLPCSSSSGTRIREFALSICLFGAPSARNKADQTSKITGADTASE